MEVHNFGSCSNLSRNDLNMAEADPANAIRAIAARNHLEVLKAQNEVDLATVKLGKFQMRERVLANLQELYFNKVHELGATPNITKKREARLVLRQRYIELQAVDPCNDAGANQNAFNQLDTLDQAYMLLVSRLDQKVLGFP